MYQGRNGYPGLDQINVTIPEAVPTGCLVSVAALSGSGNTTLESNHVTIPIAAAGGNCSDPNSFISASQAELWSGKASINWGSVGLALEPLNGAFGGSVYVPSAAFTTIPGSALVSLAIQSNVSPSSGSCVASTPGWVNSTVSGVGPFPPTLDAGSITLAGLGKSESLTEYSGPFWYGSEINYWGQPLPTTVIPATGATFTFTAVGGHDVGPFTATLNTPASPAFTNLESITTIARSQGLTVTWTGGGAGVVQISGSAAPTIGGLWLDTLSDGFSCTAPASDGQFTVPHYVLAMVPAAAGIVNVGFSPNPQFFSASGLDVGTVGITPLSVPIVNVTFQ